MLKSERIIEIVKELETKLIEDRRRFHINAELSCVEFETAKYIDSEMQIDQLGTYIFWYHLKQRPIGDVHFLVSFKTKGNRKICFLFCCVEIYASSYFFIIRLLSFVYIHPSGRKVLHAMF